MVRHVSTGGIIIEAPDTVLRQISLYCVTTILLLFSNMGMLELVWVLWVVWEGGINKNFMKNWITHAYLCIEICYEEKTKI